MKVDDRAFHLYWPEGVVHTKWRARSKFKTALGESSSLGGLGELERQRNAFLDAEVRRALERGVPLEALSTRCYQAAPGRVDLVEGDRVIASTSMRLQTSSEGEPVAHVLQGRRVSWRARIGRLLGEALARLSSLVGQ